MSQKTYGKGEVIFQKGGYGDSLFQILKGSVDIVLDGGKDNAVLTELTEGKFFGEMGALTACPRSATAIVHKDGTVLREIAWEEMDACFGTNPEIILELMKHLSTSAEPDKGIRGREQHAGSDQRKRKAGGQRGTPDEDCTLPDPASERRRGKGSDQY